MIFQNDDHVNNNNNEMIDICGKEKCNFLFYYIL